MKKGINKDFTKLTHKKAVSLIVLIITIIVIIILAAVVILIISKNNPIENAKEATFKEDVRSFQDELALAVSKEYTSKAGQRDNKFNETGLAKMQDYIPSFSEKYSEKLIIQDDELRYTDKVDEKEKEWLKELNIKEMESLLSEGYTELEYIESTGTQWIDTNILATTSTTINIDFQFNKIESYKSLFGCVIAYKLNSRFYFHTVEYFQIGYGGAGLVKVMPADTLRHTLIFNDITSSYNFCLGDLTYSIPPSNYAENGRNIMLFTQNNSIESDIKSNACSAKIYSCKIYNNNILVRDFIPVLDKNNVPCLYDKVEEKKYYNQGTGEFTVGPKK